MKYLITTLNSKYIHTSLSVRCLYSSVKNLFNASYCEYTINDSLHFISGDIYKKRADVICFGAYIWNFSQTLAVCENLKKANPDVKIVLGGPEVTYTARETLEKYDFIDIVIFGEGEITVRELFDYIESGRELYDLPGVVFRNDEGMVVVNSPREVVHNLDDLPFVYDDEIEQYKNKLIYYETSRGCPFSCSYCLSGEKSAVRYLSLDRVKSDIDFFVSHNVPLVKLVDRTFNANPSRAREIFGYIIKTASNTRFHMELAGDLIDDETIDMLSRADGSLFQFEIGVQTTNVKTMNAINRRIKWEPLKANIKKLLEKTDIHIHLDLIAGLPFEDITSFAKSFNDVLELKAHVLQLGFLKLLKGSSIRRDEKEFNYKYTSNSPYEVISNDFVSYDDIIKLHNIDFMLDKYYNSGSFTYTLEFLFDKYNNDYFLFFSNLADFFEKNGYSGKSLSKFDLYDVLYEFTKFSGLECTDRLKFDYIKSVRSHDVPKWCRTEYTQHFTDCCYNVLKDEEFKKKVFPQYYDIPAKTVFKYVRFETFGDRVIAFDIKSDSHADVTGFFR